MFRATGPLMSTSTVCATHATAPATVLFPPFSHFSFLSCPGHPTSDQHDRLARLLSSVEDQLPSEFQLHSLLTSDLGVPLPLHISLSRPLSLPTADKDAFLDRLTAAVRSSGVGPFDVAPGGLGWFRSPDSERSFLILRVAIPGAAVGAADVDAGAPCAASALNPQLLQLLSRCNGVAAAFGQPPLYQETPTAPVGSAFHISLGWSFGLPDEGSSVRSLKVLREPGFADVRAWKIPVPGVKVKIGNVIHHVSLSRAKGRRDGPR